MKVDTNPPSAARRVCIDFDGTILSWGGLYEKRPPFPGVSEAIRALKDAGYEIVILTSRLSRTWCVAETETNVGETALQFAYHNRQFVEETLRENDIPYDRITSEKVPAAIYFDDKAVRISPIFPLNVAIEMFLRGALV